VPDLPSPSHLGSDEDPSPTWATNLRNGTLALLRTSVAILVTACATSSVAAEPAPLRIRLEVARVRIGARDFPLVTLFAPPERSPGERPLESSGVRIAMPEVRAEGSRFFLRETGVEAEIVPLETSDDASVGTSYRIAPAETQGEPTGTSETPATLRRTGSGDFTEWTLAGAEGLERTMRVVRTGAPRWRVVSVRDPESKEVAALEYDPDGRLSRILTSAGIEWQLDYQRSRSRTSADLAQITARTTATAGAEMLYRARLEYADGPSPTPRLSRVMAASRVPAGVTELSFDYGTAPATAGAKDDGDARLRAIRTPRGEIEPRFDYDDAGPLLDVSTVPSEDAYDVRYPVTVRLLPEFVGEDILEDALGRRTLAFDGTGREQFRLHVENGLLVQPDGTPLDTGGAPYLIVLAPNGALYAGRGDYSSDAKLHHSSFLAGESVSAAGEIVVNAGKVVRVTSRSGHYKPPLCLLDQLSAELVRRGVALDGIPFEKGY
jgi:YD repeat-containing protein